jgi:hypothetical protein
MERGPYESILRDISGKTTTEKHTEKPLHFHDISGEFLKSKFYIII